ncbi:YbaB/EbfC family nucleoid-associated protein [Lactobacillus sp. DCY120]|uniref:Nucleoid-associated protein HU830_02070 n=1 Tax=Bombilactobacillus apium TaxID=2675299 RepID=A0A850R547_9LACO|nr:YbaB/EbfC family nucleoid-associated protein [Bombilactobacillus apium]NVY95977.1 YbaB/EbfC family nucleoid-associated protein [Bombilactobacillus apium]
MKPQMPGNMQQMLKQAQKLQKEMGQAQEQLKATEFIGQAADDTITVTFTGDYQLQDIKIQPTVIDPEDPDLLQDMIVMAVNDAMAKIEQTTQQTLGKYNPGF